MDPVLLQKQIRDNAHDVQNYLLDLKNWEEEMKRKEETLCSNSSNNEDTVPVRSKVQRNSKNVQAKTRDCRKQEYKPKKISSYDYAAWDRFDADKACEMLEQEKECTESDGSRGRDEAYYEKEMGNKFVKQMKWNEAVQCYTRAIEQYSFDAVFYANRALCHLKLQNFAAAEADSSRSLELDPCYVKAYQRRATARIELEHFVKAKSDLLKVLELEPHNSFVQGQLLKLEQKLADSEKAVEDMECFNHKENANAVDTLINNRDENGVGNHSRQQVTSQNLVLPITKPPHLRSKKSLKRIKIQEIIGSTSDEGKISKTVGGDSTSVNANLQTEVQNICNPSDQHPHGEEIGENTSEENGSNLLVPPIPTSSVQFVTAWNAVKSKPERKFQYLKQIPGDKLPHIFRESMDSNMLSEILTTLVNDFLPHKGDVYPYLKGLSQVKRFGALTMFLSKTDKSGLEELLKYCEANNECTTEEASCLRNKYEL